MTVTRPPGEVFDPFGAHLQNPYPLFARARQEEPVFWSPVVNAWVITRYEDVRAVLRDWQTFSSANATRPVNPLPQPTLEVMRGGIPMDMPGIGNSDGEDHRRQRAPVARRLSTAAVDAAAPFIRQRAEALMDAFAADRHVEVMDRYAHPLPLAVIAHLCGLDPEEAEIAYAGSYRGNQVRFDRIPEPERTANAHAFVAFHQLCQRLVQARHAAPRDDLISEVVTDVAPGDGPLSTAQVNRAAQILMVTVLAGHVTTSGVIGSALRHLLTHRDQWELLCRQPELIPNAVEEVVRYDSPTTAFYRVTTRDVTLGGRQLPAGTEILVCFSAANRDPALCDRPEVFDITRPPTRHVAFGAGPHTCLGAALARRQLAVTLETLTRRLPQMRLVPGQEFRVRGTLTIRELVELHLAW